MHEAALVPLRRLRQKLCGFENKIFSKAGLHSWDLLYPRRGIDWESFISRSFKIREIELSLQIQRPHGSRVPSLQFLVVAPSMRPLGMAFQRALGGCFFNRHGRFTRLAPLRMVACEGSVCSG
jgi:hypothetical protein